MVSLEIFVSRSHWRKTGKTRPSSSRQEVERGLGAPVCVCVCVCVCRSVCVGGAAYANIGKLLTLE